MVNPAGRLTTGPSLRDAVLAVDEQAGDARPDFYAINYSHPNEFEPALVAGPWLERIRSLRPNSSMAEKQALCQIGHLEAGDPDELGAQMLPPRGRRRSARLWRDQRRKARICGPFLMRRRGLEPPRGNPPTRPSTSFWGLQMRPGRDMRPLRGGFRDGCVAADACGAGHRCQAGVTAAMSRPCCPRWTAQLGLQEARCSAHHRARTPAPRHPA